MIGLIPAKSGGGVRGLLGAVRSSIGKKAIMAVTGFGLAIFVVFHLLGNLLVLQGQTAYNSYAATLEAIPFIMVAQYGLLFFFALHIVVALALAVQNRRARPVRYVQFGSEGNRSWASYTMVYSGLVLLVFLVLHLITFKYGTSETATIGERVVRDFYTRVLTVFQNPVMVVWYVAAVAVLGLHVSHGLHSAFRSLGFENPRWRTFLARFSVAFGVAIALGYALIPLWAFMRGAEA